MKILIVHNKEINYYPPVKSLVDILLDIGASVTLIHMINFLIGKKKNLILILN